MQNLTDTSLFFQSLPYFLHFLSAGIAIFLSAIGTGIGQGIGSSGSVEYSIKQDFGKEQSFRAMIIGLAIMESGVIFGLIMSLFILAQEPQYITLASSLADLGIGLSIGICAASVGIAASFPLRASCEAIVREPLLSQKIFTLMMVSLSTIQAPVVFAFIVSLLIKGESNEFMTVYSGVRLLAAGLVLALGAIGPAIGQAIYGKSACVSLGKNVSSFKNIFTFSLLNGAVIETPVIFSLLLSFFMIYFPTTQESFTSAVIFIAAAISMGIGSFGVGIANGKVGSSGAKQIGANVEIFQSILRTTLVSQAIIESSVIYAFIIGLLMLSRI